jgi:hypothetical protein
MDKAGVGVLRRVEKKLGMSQNQDLHIYISSDFVTFPKKNNIYKMPTPAFSNIIIDKNDQTAK